MNTYLTGQNDGIKQRGKSHGIDLIALEFETLFGHIGDNGGFDAQAAERFDNGYLLGSGNGKFVDVVKIVFLAICKTEILVGRESLEKSRKRGFVDHGIPNQMMDHEIGGGFDEGIVPIFIEIFPEHAGLFLSVFPKLIASLVNWGNSGQLSDASITELSCKFKCHDLKISH